MPFCDYSGKDTTKQEESASRRGNDEITATSRLSTDVSISNRMEEEDAAYDGSSKEEPFATPNYANGAFYADEQDTFVAGASPPSSPSVGGDLVRLNRLDNG